MIGKAMMAPPAAFGSGEVPNRYAAPLEYPSLPWYYDSTLTMYVAGRGIRNCRYRVDRQSIWLNSKQESDNCRR